MKKSAITILIATHIIAFSVGTALTKQNFLTNVIPNIVGLSSADPRYIKLSEGSEPTPYNEILSKYNLGHLYFYNPLYRPKKDEGERILSELAEQGYTPAAWSLYNHYIVHARDLLTFNSEGNFIMQNKEAYNKAYQWARIAAEQGFAGPLSAMLSLFELASFKDISEDISLLEKLAINSTNPTFAKDLSKHFTDAGETEKAAHWQKVAAEIEAKPFKHADNEVITPWRGR